MQIRKECEKITCVPFPKDPNQSARTQEFLIKQQYFFVSATIKDILRRFMKKNGHKWERLPKKMTFFLLDVNHAIGILEMIRILIDIYQLTFHQAFNLTRESFNVQTQGTLEELSMCWSTEILKRVLPRHMEIVALLDHFFLEKMRNTERIKHDILLQNRLQIITTDSNQRQVLKLSHLCYLMCNHIFTLSHQQFDLAKSVIYREMDDFMPYKLSYVPQGVNPRQWVHCQNPNLAHLISEYLGDDDEWLVNFPSLRQIRPWKSDENFISRFQRVKTENKLIFIDAVISSVTQTQYIKIPNSNFIAGSPQFQEQFITKKQIIIDDVNSFFSKYTQDTAQGFPIKKEEDLMIQFMLIDEELFKTKDEQLYKLLSFSFVILNMLIRNIAANMKNHEDEDPENEASKLNSQKILYVIQIPPTLDSALKFFLNSLKTVLLMRTLTLRLVILDGDRIIAGQDQRG